MKKLFYNSQIFVSIVFGVLLFGLGFTAQTYAIQCETGIQKRIEMLMVKDFSKKLSDTLLAEKNKSKEIGDTMNHIRQLDCELAKICEALDIHIPQFLKIKQKAGDAFTIDNCEEDNDNCYTLPKPNYPRCASVYNEGNENEDELYYTKDFFEGEAALCPALNKETFFTAADETVEFCKSRTSVTIQQSKTMVKSLYTKTSKQDDSNYYSAKLLSLTERMKSLGDLFDRLIEHVSATFTQICSCAKK